MIRNSGCSKKELPDHDELSKSSFALAKMEAEQKRTILAAMPKAMGNDNG